MRIKLFLLILVVAVTSIAFCRLNKEALAKNDLEAHYDRMIAFIQQQRPPKLNHIKPTNKIGNVYTQNYNSLVSKIWKSKDYKRRQMYSRLLVKELSNSNPDYRAISCALLGEYFDLASIKAVSSLLDDAAKTSCFIYVSAPPRQGPRGKDTVRKEEVRNKASHSLFNLTGKYFSSKDEFDEWWRENSHYKSRSWFWSRHWQPMEGQFVSMHRRIEDLSKLTDDEVICAVMAAEPNWSDDSPSCRMLATYLRKRHIKEKIISVLKQKTLLPEINSQDDFNYFVGQVRDRKFIIFSSKDESLIAQAENAVGPFKPPVADFVLMREDLVFPYRVSDHSSRALPLKTTDRSVQILAEALKKDPTLTSVAVELYQINGLGKRGLIKRSFELADSLQRIEMLQSFRMNSCWIDKAFVRDLIEYIPEPQAENYDSGGLNELSEIANSVLERHVITEKEIEAVSWTSNKCSTEDDANRALFYFKQVKRKLLKELLDTK